MKILITGANGMLAKEVKEKFAKGNDITATDVSELDITDEKAVFEFVNNLKPDYIINCAAFTNVDGCEENYDAAFKVNAIGPRNLAMVCEELGSKLVNVSTDYVFDGEPRETQLREYDKVEPQSVYGTTKLQGENYVREFSSKYYIVRTAWLYGDGKNFVKTMLALAENHDELNVVCDQVGTPTSAVELAKMIHYLEGTENYGTFHATCEGSCSWADFAEEIFRLAGKNTKVNHITSEEFAAKAPRPSYSILENYMLKLTSDYRFADWHDAIESYIKGMK